MTEPYEVLRSVSDKKFHLIVREGGLATLPNDVRNRGPWQVIGRGEVTRLRPVYRLALAQDGYCLEYTELATFKPEA